ncbi:MAG: lipoprotein signal peptidase [Bacteroidota bacterium]
MMSSNRLAWLITASVIIFDQALKFYVKTHFEHGEEYSILGLSWAFLRFEENSGMAFNWQFGGEGGKLLLTGLRIVAMFLLVYFLRQAIRDHAKRLVIVGFSLVLAGAIGNIVDSVFYGQLFSASSIDGGVAQFLPAEGGYAPLFYGAVVDMFYFPVWIGEYPDWFPFVGGQVFHFFRPIFNVADIAIFLGVLLLIREFLFGKQLAAPTEEVAKVALEEQE